MTHPDLRPPSPSASSVPRRAAIIQSSYIPWKGYFDIINLVDEFILYDDVQFTKNDWRNRNLVKTGSETSWLTIPVRHKGRFGQSIREVEIADRRWAKKHWRTLQTYYARAGAFDELASTLERLYDEAAAMDLLSRVNELFLRALAELLGITTRITRVSAYDIGEDRVERLVDLCEAVGAREYVSGPSAAEYLDEEPFGRRGIEVRWMGYEGYPEYTQLSTPPFLHRVSILDLLLNEGPSNARRYLLTTEESEASPDLPDLPLARPPARPEGGGTG